MARIIHGTPVYQTTEPEFIDRDVRRYGGRGSLVLFLVLILLAGWIFANRGFGYLGYGINKDTNVLGGPTTKTTDTVTVEVSKPVGSVELPVTIPPAPQATVPPPIPDNIELLPLPSVTVQEPDVIGYARTTADAVNMRTGPGINYRAVLVLPTGWQMAVLRQSHLDNTGEVWIEVGVWTNRGFERGWINQRYLVLI